jgi:DnaJ-class molecular chaperone
MAGNAQTTNPLRDCPVCRATGKVESRLPARKQVCPECGGRGRVTPTRREQLLGKTKPEAQ